MTPLILKIFPIKIRLKNRLQILNILIFNNFLALSYAQNTIKNEGIKDSINSRKDTLLPKKKEVLEAVVKYSAKNIRTDIPTKMSYLNQEAKIDYQDMKIEADYISIDWNTGMVFARGKQDEKGKLIEPVKLPRQEKPMKQIVSALIIKRRKP